MYNFIDVNEVSENMLPSEALQINGQYIEELIDGYRTLSVSGREALSSEIETFSTGIRDGTNVRYKRYPERILIIRYQLKAETADDFREKFNVLGRILSCEDAELIFNDEQDKFYIGTPHEIGEIEPGNNAVIGEFTILCADPFKYSVLEYEAENPIDENTILIDYGGTYRAYPVLEADFFNESDINDDGSSGTLTGKGECGFVAFFNENQRIIQLGDVDEKDGVNQYEKSQTLLNQTFKNTNAWSVSAASLWKINQGNPLQTSVRQLGSIGIGVASYTEAKVPETTSGTILSKQTTGGAPLFNYKVTANASERKASSVKINVAITSSLKYTTSYFGHGYGIKGSIYMGGTWHSVILKNTSEYWEGQTGHTKNISFTVSGLSSGTTLLTGIKFKVERTDGNGDATGKLPETSCSNLKISNFEESVPDTYYLSASSFGTADGTWHGPAMMHQIKEDAAGVKGAKNFTLTYGQKICANKETQMGGFQLLITTSDNRHIAGVRIYKNASGFGGHCDTYVNGKKVAAATMYLSFNNKYFGSLETSVNSSTIIKEGNRISFDIGGYKTQVADEEIREMCAEKIVFVFEQYSSNPPMVHNGIYSVRFTKNNCDTWKDIPNKFCTGDIVKADCKLGKIFLNGLDKPEYGALGNDWEEFYLSPGINQIGFAYSDWVPEEYKPVFKVKYREVFV